MIIKIRKHNEFRNIGIVIVLLFYTLILQFINKSDGPSIILMTGIQIILVFYVSISRLITQKLILDPAVWLPPIFSIVNLTSCFFSFTDQPMFWFEPYRKVFQSEARFYLTLNVIALIGFYLGNIIIIKGKQFDTVNISKIPLSHIRTIIRRLYLLTIILIALSYYGITISGGLDMASQNRGLNQFSGYGGVLYLISVFSTLMYYAVISLGIPSLFIIRKKKYFAIFFILLSIYIFPSIYTGSRSSTIFLIIVFLINYFIFYKNSQKIINFKSIIILIASFCLLIIFFGLVRNVQGGSFSAYLLHFFSEMQLTSGVGMTTVHLFPNTHLYYYGATYASAFFNLLPNILFGGERPFVNPSLVFHELFAPEMTNIGFGFSMFAEAYMNGGAIGVFIFFFLFSLIIGSYFNTPKKTIIGISMLSLLFISIFWFLRGDSTTFIKTIIFVYIIYKVVTYKRFTAKA